MTDELFCWDFLRIKVALTPFQARDSCSLTPGAEPVTAAFRRTNRSQFFRFAAIFVIAGAVGALVAKPACAQDAAFKIPDRVPVNYDGIWYPGSVYAVRDGKFKVLRDDYTSDDRWVTNADLKRAPVGARATPPMAGLPSSVPLGLYTCGTLLSGSMSSSPMGTTIGQLRIVDKGVYTSLVKEGTGARARFAYDAATGKIEWEGGRIAGFFGKATESRFSFDNRGKPIIQVTYRVREGGNLFDLSCLIDRH
jgi:hypothetical protein